MARWQPGPPQRFERLSVVRPAQRWTRLRRWRSMAKLRECLKSAIGPIAKRETRHQEGRESTVTLLALLVQFFDSPTDDDPGRGRRRACASGLKAACSLRKMTRT